MTIGIDASRAFQKNRTGIEEYSYQVIKQLIPLLENEQVVLFVRTTNYESDTDIRITNNLPNNWQIKVIKFPYLWTQIGLSLELLLRPVDVLFILAHIAPFICPENTVVAIHGLEYEFCPKAYSFWARMYMRWGIKRSCRVARTIIAVSNNTKGDLVRLYGVAENKIKIIYEGANNCHSGLPPAKAWHWRAGGPESSQKKQVCTPDSRLPALPADGRGNDKYLLFIGRLEERKNILGILEAYKILKEKYNIPHSLVLAGAPGYGYELIKSKINETKRYLENIILQNPTAAAKCSMPKIIELGYVSEEEKQELVKNADVFLFPTFYEGFGLPILEAQSAGVPVVASNNSSIPEVVGCHSGLPPAKAWHWRAGDPESQKKILKQVQDDKFSALLVDPYKSEEIAKATYELISGKDLREEIIKSGYENAKRFSWQKCAEEIAKMLEGLDKK